MISVLALSFTVSLKLPSGSEMVVLLYPFALIVAPTIGKLFFVSVTFPITSLDWAKREILLQNNKANNTAIFLMRLVLVNKRWFQKENKIKILQKISYICLRNLVNI